MVVLIGSVGLTIDSGVGYMSRAKLNAAVDAAGIAGARAVTQGADQAAQAASARQAAREFFAANYPSGYLGSTPTLDDPTISFDRGQVTIDVSAHAGRPLFLMPVLGLNRMNVAAASQTIRKDVDLSFVMDTSGSMSGVAQKVRDGGISFLQFLSPTADRVALIHFATGGLVDDPIRKGQARGFDRAAMQQHIGNFQFAGHTNHAEGMWLARDQLNGIALGDRSTLRVIVFFSDGTPNTFASYMSFKNPVSCPPMPAANGAVDGAVLTGDYPQPPGNPTGLYRHDQQDAQAPSGPCRQGNGIAGALQDLPAFYNAHDPAATEFPIVTTRYRTITNAANPPAAAWKNINLASRNLAELMADKSKAEGIYVFTLGLGPLLKNPFGVADASGIDTGEELLKCMANTMQPSPPDTLPPRCHDAAKPRGVYCYAATADDLKPCFAQLAAEIVRITK